MKLPAQPPSSPLPETGTLSDADLRQAFRADKAAQIEKYRASGKIDTLMRGLARNADRTLSAIWQDCHLPGGLTLVAVGGYGRGELAPHSDIDILVLLPVEPDEALTGRLERFIGCAWDLGLDVGSSVRTIDQCIDEAVADITVQTSLLEARRIVGNTQLFERFLRETRHALDPRTFFQAKLLEMRQRHAKYQDTPYSLEPNCKESPGGLRDLQVIVWMARAAGLGSTWQEFEQSGLITAHEAQELRRNEFFLKTLRARLHILANRRQDVLVFDLQTALAEAFGYRASASRRASEPLMRRYYWAAKAVTQLSTILIQNIEARLNPDQSGITRVLSRHFVEKQGMIEIIADDLFEREPTAILEAFLLYEKIQGVKGLSARTLRALYNSRNRMTLGWRRDPENRRLFLEILQQPAGITRALRLMNQTSVLGSYLTNFGRIVGQMQHDLYHVYTVDQHILTVLRNIRRYGSSEHAHEYPFCSDLFANFERPWVLYVTALFHDIAKGRGGDHSILGTTDARRFCREHGIDENDSALIVWLVEHHLTMSQVAQKQDTSDPAVINAFADLVASERRLTALYLLTVADIRGTSPKVWNAWKGKLLEDLYRLTRQVLGGAAPDSHSDLARRREAARAELRLKLVPPGAEAPLWEQLDVSYFLRHEPGEIAWQTQKLLPFVTTDMPVVRARPSPIGEGLQVLVYSKDRPDLFASICGYFNRHGLSVQQALIHTTRHGYALDDFLVSDPNMEAHHRDIANLVEQELAAQLQSSKGLPDLSKGRLSRLSRAFPMTPRIDLRPDERGQYFILSLSANDRAGLLYSIAKVLAEHHIGVRAARIDTLGDRVEDVFLIEGGQLADSRTQIRLETELLGAIAI
ncbi:[protein-PII] uridylyltransferase [Robbsia sp. Bb-Pol-6]|uniref:Bifunctional uridylyltransferase/uridylyl-removing enzyme n=1 Tax=Robbsia betulipollinis TaxID=2981849 RepID=A0ABT3ZIR9_9BURK|nr:[protein-PII] uridylyltransferase [Robbsia betulipollinis]MCY0386317.1 [protein-PII] uridylyltransferase [Robbsia betulipollinis]